MRLALLLVLLASVAEAQTVTGDRFQLNTGPCTERSGSGAPSTSLGVVCDTYQRTDSPYTKYVKTAGATWTPVVAVDGVAVGQVLASNGTGATPPVYTASPSLTAIGGAANLTLQPTGDVVFNPTGNDLLPTTGYDLNIGALTNKFLTLHAAELWVETLVAQDTIATIGGRVLVGPTTQLTADLSSGGTTITVKHNQIANGDRIVLQANGAIEWMAVASVAGGSAGAYTYTVTRNLDGSGASAWTAGDAVFNSGTTGDGFIDLYSISAITPPRFQYIYNFNTTGSAFSSNYAEALSWEFWGDGADNATNDAVYFGAAATFTAMSNEAMTTCSSASSTLLWEYWNGSAWTSFSPSGTTCVAGHNTLTWSALSGWATTTVNSNSAFWIRLRTSSYGGTPHTTAILKHSVRTSAQWGPTIVGNVRTGTTYSDVEARWAIGNLNGLYDYAADTYGVALGSPSAAWVKIDPTNGVRLGNGATTKVQITAAGDASFAEDFVTIDQTGIEVEPVTATGTFAATNAYRFDVVGSSAVMGIGGIEEVGTDLATLSLVNTVPTGDTSIISLTAAAASGGTAASMVMTGGTAAKVEFGNDLIVSENNASTAAQPYIRSDGNYLVIESRSAANGGVLYLNNDQNGPVYVASGGGGAFLFNASFVTTAPNWGAGMSQLTVGAAGKASALPANPSQYLHVNLNGVAYVIPAYTP